MGERTHPDRHTPVPVTGGPSTSAPPIPPANLPTGHTPVPPHLSSRHRTAQSHRRRPSHRRGGPPRTATDHQENSPGSPSALPPSSSRRDAWIPTSTPTSHRCCASTTTSPGHGRSGRPQPTPPSDRAAWAQIWPRHRRSGHAAAVPGDRGAPDLEAACHGEWDRRSAASPRCDVRPHATLRLGGRRPAPAPHEREGT